MKMSWFQYNELTEAQANALVDHYRAKNVRTEKKLSPDYLTWSVSVLLPESAKPPRPDRRYQQRYWG